MPEHAHTGIDIRKLLDVVRTMVGEVHPHWKNLHFTPDTHLERDLGLDSMARMELRTRIETQFGVSRKPSPSLRRHRMTCCVPCSGHLAKPAQKISRRETRPCKTTPATC
jgi:hypothetical protein